MGRWIAPAVGLSAALILAGCSGLSDRAVLREASGGRLEVRYGQLILGNDRAFRSKLGMIQDAQTSVDVMYYIYTDDHSSSVLSEALLAAAQRGVRVRLLVDYHYNYRLLDHFTMLEARARGSRGSLEVRFYNRPTRNIVMDAALLTLGCPAGAAGGGGAAACSPARMTALRQRFADERVDGRPAAEVGISNLNVGGSGLFLSGLYARRPDVMALAVLQGAGLDGAAAPATGAAGLATELQATARLYEQSGALPPFARLVTDLRLATVFARDGVSSNATFEALRPYLPPERAESAPGARDWEYLTDFLHHKLLLVDGQRVQLGGRNIEDSYHMRPNPLLDKYVFVDTDLYATLERGGEHLQRAFEALWSFRAMVASTAEIRQHAPNDFVANLPAYGAAMAACAGTAPGPGREACLAGEFGRRAVALAGREQQHATAMGQRARAYYARYPHAAAADDAPAFDLDPGALVAYVENLPFRGRRPAPPYERSYGAENGAEARHGKHIHALWRAGLLNACRTAGERPGPTVVLHNAYFFPPSNLVETFGRMADGSVDCRGASVVVLTNSAETTDLNVINLLARHSLKAFVDHLATRRDAAQSAQFAIYEYRKFGGVDRISLHTKVSVLGDDIIVGSANADVRSYMMDSNNGFFIRGAPRFRQEYLRHLDELMRDETKTRDMTAYYRSTPRTAIVEEDRRTFRLLLAEYGADQWLAPPLQAELEQRFVGLLDLVYELTRATLEGGRKGREKAAEFNRLFKPL